jgi:hypothetical protein
MAAKKKVAKKGGSKKKTTKTVDPLARVREICLAFPESSEVEAWGEPTFRVKGKIFAMHASAGTHHGAGRQAIWIMSDSTTQDLLMRARPTQYFKPPYVGPSGWVGAWLDGRPIWSEINELLRDAFRKRAPKKIAALLGD